MTTAYLDVVIEQPPLYLDVAATGGPPGPPGPSFGFNVKDYGAVGDGTTDDRSAVQAALDAAGDAGGGEVFLPAGVYLVSLAEMAAFPGYYAALMVPPNVSLRGAGAGATTIRLAPNQSTDGSMIRNTTLTGGDEGISVSDLTVDGNGANQTMLHSGIAWEKVRGVRHTRVRAMNFRGTAAFPPGETFQITAYASSDVFYDSCEVVGTAGTQGSGFGSNYCTNVLRVNCIAHSMSAGMGYADYRSTNVSNVNCIAQDCGGNGFNVEFCVGYSLLGCISGGKSPASDIYPHPASTNLGNAGDGIVVNATVDALIADCLVTWNGGAGLNVVSSGGITGRARVSGGIFASNGGSGARFGDPACAEGSFITRATDLTGNASDLNIQGSVGIVNADFELAAPAIPASTVPLTNPYPFQVNVHVSNGTLFLLLAGGSNMHIGTPTTFISLTPGKTVQINYSAAPSWLWFRA